MSPAEALASERQNVGAGWQPLIDDLHGKLVELDPGYRVDQIKEKWGGLRYYLTPTEDADLPALSEMWDLVWAAEEKSLTICEDCGATGGAVTTQASPGGYWVRTLCTGCRGGGE